MFNTLVSPHWGQVELHKNMFYGLGPGLNVEWDDGRGWYMVVHMKHHAMLQLGLLWV
jgi:hypothetical protein